ncbi:MAG: allantoinase AllB [Alicyclobacillaceae bacterium]|nr:allantoinase AllB [Alicyclobacillaceae bacterium]
MMPENADWIIRGGRVVLDEETCDLDIVVRGGVIAEFTRSPERYSLPVFDVQGMTVMPGMIDVHVHFNEPGREDWEGFETGSAALAAGGCTTYVDMPLNSLPPTVRVSLLEQKAALAGQKSVVDYAFWGGLVPQNLEDIEGLSEAGVVGFKAFMSSPGTQEEGDFQRVDDDALLRGMRLIARTGKILMLHAEDEQMVSALTADKRRRGRVGIRDYLQSRPPEAERIAVRKALHYARLTSCRLHFAHVSWAETVAEIDRAKQEGLDVTLETCPHYLILTEDDAERIGPVAKCAPPLRSRENRERLWALLAEGRIDMISSDHSPCPPSMKIAPGGDMFDVWGGIAAGQSSYELILDEGHIRRGLPLPDIARWVAYNPAKRLGFLPRKGRIAPGYDADLVVVNFAHSYTLRAEDLYDRHRQSPYIGRRLSCRIEATLNRGRVVYRRPDGIVGGAGGQWIKPGCTAGREGGVQRS